MTTMQLSGSRFTPVSSAAEGTLTGMVLNLLDAAEAAFDRDREAARALLSRASALLQSAREDRLPVSQPAPALPPRGGLARWQVNRVTAYIDANLGATIRARDLIGVTQLSASHFFRAFKESFGEPPFAYVARRRMALAQKMMLGTDESLCQIALSCGLCDQAHFTRVFRRIVGLSPSAWRRQHRPDPVTAGAGDTEFTQ